MAVGGLANEGYILTEGTLPNFTLKLNSHPLKNEVCSVDPTSILKPIES